MHIRFTFSTLCYFRRNTNKRNKMDKYLIKAFSFQDYKSKQKMISVIIGDIVNSRFEFHNQSSTEFE